jgi:hypothetical protein
MANKNKPLYEVKYSSGRKAIVHWKPKKGKASGEARQMGVKIVSVKRIKKPNLIQKLRSW